MASFPTSNKTFASRSNGQTIDASHVGDLQDEVAAIEDGYLNGTARLNSSNSTLATLSVTGASTFAGAVTFSGSVTGISVGYPADGRLTLTTATPVTTSDVTAATTLYYALHVGNKIALYDGSSVWNVRAFTELSIAVPATTDTMYDVFIYDNSGTPTLELTAWTNDTTRATALTRQDGVYVKTGATTRRYVGSFRTTAVSGQTEDSLAKRYVWNYYHRERRPLRVHDATNSWNYTTATIRQANGSTANQVYVVVGVAEVAVEITALVTVTNSGNGNVAVGIGEDATNANATEVITHLGGPGSTLGPLTARLCKIPGIGRHFYAWLEWAQAVGTATWYGDNGDGTVFRSGLSGHIEG